MDSPSFPNVTYVKDSERPQARPYEHYGPECAARFDENHWITDEVSDPAENGSEDGAAEIRAAESQPCRDPEPAKLPGIEGRKLPPGRANRLGWPAGTSPPEEVPRIDGQQKTGRIHRRTVHKFIDRVRRGPEN